MTVIQTVVPRINALEYDGTNADDIVTAVCDYYQTPGMFTIGSEGEGVVVLQPNSNVWNSVTMSLGDHMIIQDAQACTPEQFARRYTVLA